MASVITQMSDDYRDSEVNNSLEVTIETNMLKTSMPEESGMQTNEATSNSEGRKRSRPVDEEEIWTEVGRKGKVRARSMNHNELMRVPEEQIEISLISRKEKLPKQIGLARILKSENISDVVQIKYVNDYKILLRFNQESSAEKLLNCKYFIEREYKCQKTFEVGVSYGVVRDIDLELNEEQLQQEFSSDIPIINIKRLQRRKYESSGFENSECVRLCFKGPTLPSHIYTYGTRVKVEPYVFPVTQCSICWRFGHNHKACPQNKIFCPKCGGAHPNCEVTTFKCINCTGQHMALAKNCPIYLKEKKLRELMAEHNCTYKKALTYIPRTIESKITRINEAQENLDQSDSDENLVEITNTSLLNKPVDIPQSPVLMSKLVKKKVGKQNNDKNYTPVVEESSSDYDNARNYEEVNIVNTERRDNEQDKKLNLAELVQKCKDIIFMKKMTFDEKLKACGSLLYEWIVSNIVEYLSEWPVLKNFIQNG